MLNFSAQPNIERKENSVKGLEWVLIAILILMGISVRLAGLDFISIDMRHFFLGWYDKFVTNGFAALREPFSKYTPPYLYLMFFTTKTFGFLPKVTAIKLIPIGFDFLSAILVYKILKIRYPHGVTALLGAVSFLLLPTVLLNSAYWAQIESIYTFFILVCIYFLMQRQSLWGMIAFGLAFSFKAQAAFLAPLLFLLMVRKQISWLYLGIVPIVYAIMMIPAALTGRPVMELLTIYANQASTYRSLSAHAPNLYLFIPENFYTSGLIIGLTITVLVTLTWTAIYARRIEEFSPQTILLCALASTAFVPFFLPKMHDRYFYPADVLAFLVAFYLSGRWLLMIGFQIVSGLAYVVTIALVNPLLMDDLLIGAAIINTVLIGYVFWTQWKLTDGSAKTV